MNKSIVFSNSGQSDGLLARNSQRFNQVKLSSLCTTSLRLTIFRISQNSSRISQNFPGFPQIFQSFKDFRGFPRSFQNFLELLKIFQDFLRIFVLDYFMYISSFRSRTLRRRNVKNKKLKLNHPSSTYINNLSMGETQNGTIGNHTNGT